MLFFVHIQEIYVVMLCKKKKRMKQTYLVIVIFVVVVVFYYINKGAVAKNLSFTTGTPRQISLRGGNLSFTLPINARNISKGKATIDGADMSISIDGNYVGKAFLNTQIVIQPLTVTVIPVQAEASFFDLLPVLPGIIKKFPEFASKGTLPFQVKGFILSEGLRVPYEQVFNIPVPNLSF